MAVKFQDYYQILGVARDATPEAIKLGFRKLARIHHPDVAKDKVAGEAAFKQINEAYEVLGNPDKKRRYDELGEQGEAATRAPFASDQRPSGESGFEYEGTGFSDFFESFFGGNRAGGASPPHGGRDIEADLLVTLEEALRGSLRSLTLRRPAAAGAPERTDSYQVRIPPGIGEGQRIRLAGQGSPGHGGAAAGDLYLRVRLAAHPDFSVAEGNLFFDLALAPWEAVLGVTARIPTLDGWTTLRVPPDTVDGLQLRLRGLGLPRGPTGRGDLFAIVRLCTPSSSTAEERALWAQLARVSLFKPRTES